MILLVVAGTILIPKLVAVDGQPPSQGPVPVPIQQNLPLGGLAVSRDWSRVYVTNFVTGTVSVIDPAKNAVIGNPIQVGRRPAGLAVTADHRRVYVANSDDSTVSVIDTTTNTTSTITVPPGPFGVAARLDRPYVYVTSFEASKMSVMDAATGKTVGDPIVLRGHPSGVAVHAQGHRVYVVDDTGTLSVIDTATNKIDTVTIGHYPFAVAVGPGGVNVYVTTLQPNSLVVINTATNATAGSPIALPPGPFGVAVGEKGFVYATNFDSGNVMVIDTTTGTVVGDPIRVPISPRGMAAVDRDAHRLYVSDGAGTVSVIDTRTRATVGDPIILPSG
jgi:YVTN family beta-propeller protein